MSTLERPRSPSIVETRSADNDRLAGIHSSSWVAWVCHAITFALAIGLDRTFADRLLAGIAGPLLLIASTAVFLLSVIAIQHYMDISLRCSRFGEPAKLVTSGIFAYSRNPIYLAFLVPIGAIGLYAPLAALAGAVGYIATMDAVVIRGEERDLERVFGEDFRAWKSRTPRWLLW
jgi:protein-S-isoprenylcysteine O-methyltransferase Ste14